MVNLLITRFVCSCRDLDTVVRFGPHSLSWVRMVLLAIFLTICEDFQIPLELAPVQAIGQDSPFSLELASYHTNGQDSQIPLCTTGFSGPGGGAASLCPISWCGGSIENSYSPFGNCFKLCNKIKKQIWKISLKSTARIWGFQCPLQGPATTGLNQEISFIYSFIHSVRFISQIMAFSASRLPCLDMGAASLVSLGYSRSSILSIVTRFCQFI